MYPTLDPEFAAVIASAPDVDFADVAASRAVLNSMTQTLHAELSLEGISVQEITAPGLDSNPDVPVRLIRPEEAGDQLLPVLVWIHGGGFTLGTSASSDPFCVDVARELGVVVANVEYRLAPETPFPGPLDDCYAALVHIYTHAVELGIDPARIAVGGQSAGGGLAAGTVLKARDNGVVSVAFQYLDIPVLDDRLATVSMTTFTDTPNWHRPNAILSWKFYLGEHYSGPEDPDVSIYAAPARATDLSGLPPTYLCTMELDPLRDEGIDYALRLLHAGVSVELHSYPGTFHGSSIFTTAEVSKRGFNETLNVLRRGLFVPATPGGN